jgi:hypothetical protein
MPTSPVSLVSSRPSSPIENTPSNEDLQEARNQRRPSGESAQLRSRGPSGSLTEQNLKRSRIPIPAVGGHQDSDTTTKLEAKRQRVCAETFHREIQVVSQDHCNQLVVSADWENEALEAAFLAPTGPAQVLHDSPPSSESAASSATMSKHKPDANPPSALRGGDTYRALPIASLPNKQLVGMAREMSSDVKSWAKANRALINDDPVKWQRRIDSTHEVLGLIVNNSELDDVGFRIAAADGKTIGILVMTDLDCEVDSDPPFIARVVSHPSPAYHRTGSYLIQYAVQLSQDRNQEGKLSLVNLNEGSYAIYKRLGFMSTPT